MQETFEQNIEQQLSSFSLPPSPQVWQEVDAALHPKRKKRLLIWWWLPLLGLMIGGFGYWVMENRIEENKRQVGKIEGSKEQVVKEQENKEQVGKMQESKKQVEKKPIYDGAEVSKKAIIIAQSQQVTSKKILTITDLHEDLEKQKEGNVNNQTNQIKSTLPDNIEQMLANKIPNLAIIESKVGPTITPKIITEKEAIAKENEPIITASDSLQKNKKSLTDTANTAKKINIQATAKKHQWLVLFGGGLLSTKLNNNNGNYLFANGSAVLQPNLNPVTGNSTADSQFQQANTGFHFEIGLQYQKQLSKNWQLATGFQYRYLQNKQPLRGDTAVIPVFNNLAISNSFISGNSITKTNNTHWLQVPISINHLINPSAKNQWGIVFGGSVAWAFTEQWLVTDNVAKRYYYDASKYNSWLFNLHGGLSYHHHSGTNITLQTEYSVTPIHKNTTDKYHFLQFGLQISKPIHFNHKSSTKN